MSVLRPVARPGEDRNTITASTTNPTQGKLRPVARPGEDRNPYPHSRNDCEGCRLRPVARPGEDRNNVLKPLLNAAPRLRPVARPGEDRNYVITPGATLTAGAAPGREAGRGSQLGVGAAHVEHVTRLRPVARPGEDRNAWWAGIS